MIVAVHRPAIDAAYGAGSWTRLRGPLGEYVVSLRSAGIRPSLLYLDKPADAGITDEDAATIGDTAGAAQLIRAVARKSDLPPPAVLLVGGDEALPMFRFPRKDTVPGDLDADIPTDNPYGCLREGVGVEVDPELAVGRIAAGVDDGVEALIARLQAARRDRPRTPQTTGALVVSNTEWIEASQAVAAQIADVPRMFRSSPYYAVTSDRADDLSRRVLFFNLHGVANTSDWYGASAWTAVSPASLDGASLGGSVVFACNCYGASLADRSSATSIALQCLRRGSSCFVGSTGYAFGALPPQTCDFSEELARRFFALLATGRAAGLALRQARRDYVRARVAGGRLGNRDYKTALQFVFLGDPLL